MILDLLWGAGQVISIAALLYGGYLVLMETDPFLRMLGKKSSVSHLLSSKDWRFIEKFAGRDADGALSGNRVIDEEHRGLFADVDNLRSALLAGRSADEINAMIGGLFRHLYQHFEHEEEILLKAAYPGVAAHAAQHRELANGSTTLMRYFHAGELSMGELFRFLAEEVVANHVLIGDRELIPCLADAGGVPLLVPPKAA